VAEKYGVSEAQLLLRRGVQNGYAVLPRTMDPARMRQNLDHFGFAIEDGDMATMKTTDRGDGAAWPFGQPRNLG